MKFYKEIDEDENITFDQTEIRDFFEKYAKDEKVMGMEKIRKVLIHLGVNPQAKLAFFKEGNVKSMKFPDEIYEKVVYMLANDRENVEFSVS